MAKRKRHWTERQWLGAEDIDLPTRHVSKQDERDIAAGRMLRELARRGYEVDIFHDNGKWYAQAWHDSPYLTAQTWDAAIRKLIRAIRREEVGSEA